MQGKMVVIQKWTKSQRPDRFRSSVNSISLVNVQFWQRIVLFLHCMHFALWCLWYPPHQVATELLWLLELKSSPSQFWNKETNGTIKTRESWLFITRNIRINHTTLWLTNITHSSSWVDKVMCLNNWNHHIYKFGCICHASYFSITTKFRSWCTLSTGLDAIFTPSFGRGQGDASECGPFLVPGWKAGGLQRAESSGPISTSVFLVVTLSQFHFVTFVSVSSFCCKRVFLSVTFSQFLFVTFSQFLLFLSSEWRYHGLIRQKKGNSKGENI